MDSKLPRGTITTLLDLTDRDVAESDLFPLSANTTWFTRDPERATIMFTPQVQTIKFRGPAAWGQRFTFDLGSLKVGDVMFGAVLQLQLGHWLDATTLLALAGGQAAYTDPSGAWEYANCLGTAAIAKAELEIDGVTIETIDGDWIDVVSRLFADYNTQVGISYDALGRVPIATLRGLAPRAYPTEDGYIHCPLLFFFGRTRYQEALPMIAIKEGLVRIHVTLRPFTEVVRQVRGYRDSCDATPLGKTIELTTGPVVAAQATPDITSVALLTHGALLNGDIRTRMLREPFEMMHREVQTFWFEEPLKYATAKRSDTDTIIVQLPLEANHPLEEIVWFVRRKGVTANNEWTNYSDTLEADWKPTQASFLTKPMVQNAKIQVNGITLVEAEEQYFRQHIAAKHRGGYAAFSNYVYGYSFAERPGQFQPTGSINASRANSLRLTLEVKPPPSEDSWEVKVFCVALNWMRFENGLAGAVFED